VDENAVRTWWADYLTAYAALGRGEAQPADVGGFYSTPMLLTTDDVATTLATVDEVHTWLQAQAASMGAADYHHTEILDSGVEILNRTTAILRFQLARQRSDGSEISRMTVTYLVVDDSENLSIKTLVLHSS
jgi:hypothetical protein